MPARIDAKMRRAHVRTCGVHSSAAPTGMAGPFSPGLFRKERKPPLVCQLFLHLGGKLGQRERLRQEGIGLVIIEALLEGVVGIP